MNAVGEAGSNGIYPLPFDSIALAALRERSREFIDNGRKSPFSG